MFSVDNFYTIFNSYYGWPKKNNIIFTFSPHGSKDWKDLTQWGDFWKTSHNVDEILSMGTFIMHDQEPVEIKQIENYIKLITSTDNVEKFINEDPAAELRYRIHHQIAKDITPFELVHLTVRTLQFPILCHSELNSPDIIRLEQNHIIPCYYWWHGLISRDWFRHWERYADLVTYNKSRVNYRFLLYARAFDGTRTYRTDLVQFLNKNPTQILYNRNNQNLCPTLSATIDVEDANNSAIHIVAETLFDSEKIYLTEKVFKPMVMCQPFILFGPPNSLQYLRRYGFKTFDTLWDEGYDLITSAGDRKQALFQLIENLSNLNEQEFADLYQRMLPIIEHNRNWFFSADFQNLLWNEMQKNCSDALLKATELSEQHYGGSWLFYLNQFITKNSYVYDRWSVTLKNLISDGTLDENKVRNCYPNLSKII